MLKPNIFVKIFFLFFCLGFINLLAIDVLVTKERIKFNERISVKKLTSKKTNKIYRHCVPIKLNDLNEAVYISKHYISKGSILCEKDIKKYEKNSIVFNFGSLEIEKDGKVINDTKKYIKIKKPNGKVEKIYKDGRIR